MRRHFILAAATAAVLVAGGIGSAAHAWNGEDDHASDAALMAKSKITLEQAIAAAQTETGGKAFRASMNNEDNHAQFEVAVVKADKTMNVIVDPQTGAVVRAAADTDEDDAHESD